MASLNGLIARLRGDRVNELAAEVASLRELTLGMNHTIHQLDRVMHDTYEMITAVNQTVMTTNHHVLGSSDILDGLNHDVRAGAEDALPLFLGYTERLRLDTDTAIGAASVIERQLAVLEELLAAREAPEPT